MPDAFKFELVSPEKLVLSADVESVVVPGSEGDMTVMAHHAPVMTTIRTGIVVVKGAGVDKRLFVRGGFADIGKAGLTILAEKATAVEDIDRATLEAEIKEAQDAVKAAEGSARNKAEEVLQGLKDLAAAM